MRQRTRNVECERLIFLLSLDVLYQVTLCRCFPKLDIVGYTLIVFVEFNFFPKYMERQVPRRCVEYVSEITSARTLSPGMEYIDQSNVMKLPPSGLILCGPISFD